MQAFFQSLKAFFTSARVKSFLWHTGAMAVAGLIQIVIDSLGNYQLPTQTTVVIGLILGQLSKYLNDTYGSSADHKQ